jgi:hypothetical protein
MGQLILKSASASRPSGDWNDDDYDVLADARGCRPYLEGPRSPGGSAVDVDVGLRTPRRSQPATREAAIAAFAKSWQRGAIGFSHRPLDGSVVSFLPLHERPPTGGSHGKPHWTTEILGDARRRGGGVAARGAPQQAA